MIDDRPAAAPASSSGPPSSYTGMTDDRTAADSGSGVDWGDVGRSALAGAADIPFGIAGAAGDIEGAGRQGLNWLGSETGWWSPNVSTDTLLPTSGQLQTGAAKSGVPILSGLGETAGYQPTSTLGRFTKIGTEALGSGVVTGGAGAALRGVRTGADVVSAARAAMVPALRSGAVSAGGALGSTGAAEAATDLGSPQLAVPA